MVRNRAEPKARADGDGPSKPCNHSPSPQAVQALEQFATAVEAKLIKHKKGIVSE